MKTIHDYYGELKRLIDRLQAWDKSGKKREFGRAVQDVVGQIMICYKAGKKLIFIGNGASASIASHQANDFWKTAGVKAIAFNDAALLTCISNDYGYEHVFEKPLETFAESGDILIAISSSGRSENIVRAAKAAVKKGCAVVTLTGFSKGNPLSGVGDVNFHVPKSAYSHVEILHHSISHYILELVAAETRGKAGG